MFFKSRFRRKTVLGQQTARTYVVVGESLCLVQRRVAADHHRLESLQQNVVAERRARQNPVAVYVAALQVHKIYFVDFVLPH